MVFTMHAFAQKKSEHHCYIGEPRDTPIKIKSKIHDKGNLKSNVNQGLNFDVDYSDFTAEAKTAFEYALQIWSAQLESDVPITITANWDSFPPGGGSAIGNPQLLTAIGLPYTSTYYNLAIINKIKGIDTREDLTDMEVTFNSNINWHYGLDADPEPSQLDFVSVAIHEIGHGLGFSGGSKNNGTTIFGGPANIIPFIWSRFVEEGDGTKITTFANNSPDLINALKGDDLYFNGPFAKANNTNLRPKIYVPDPYRQGSSYKHLHPSENSIMGPQLNFGDAKHVIDDVTLGILFDLGWLIPEITVQQPFANSNHLQGDKLNISWNSENIIGNVELNLFKDEEIIWQFTPNTLNDGFHEVTIPMSILSDDGYSVQVKARDVKANGFSDTFSIGNTNASISITDPNSTSVIQQGQPYTFMWTSDGVVGNVKIQLFKNNVLKHTHTTNTLNDGNHEFNIPSFLVSGSDYVLKIAEVNGSVFGESEEFTIGNPITVIPEIEFLFPTATNGMLQFDQGQSITISWVDNIEDRLIMSMYEEGSQIPTLINSNILEGQTTQNFSFPSNLEDGKYKFRLVYNNDGGETVYGINSSYFTVGNVPLNVASGSSDLGRQQSGSTFYEIVKTSDGQSLLLEGDFVNSTIQLLDSAENVVSTYNNQNTRILISIEDLPEDLYFIFISNDNHQNQKLQINLN